MCGVRYTNAQSKKAKLPRVYCNITGQEVDNYRTVPWTTLMILVICSINGVLSDTMIVFTLSVSIGLKVGQVKKSFPGLEKKSLVEALSYSVHSELKTCFLVP